MSVRQELIPSGTPGGGAPVLRAPDPFASDPFAPDDETSWFRDALGIALERRWTIAGVIALGLLAVAGYLGLVPSTRLYEARAQVLVEPEVPYPLEFGPTMASGGREESYYETQYRILKSRSLARWTLASLALQRRDQPSPSPASASSSPPPSQTSAPPAPGVPAAPAETGGAGAPASPPEPTPEQIQAVTPASVDEFLRALSVATVPDSRLVEIRFRWRDAAYAARAVNAHTHAYVRQSVEQTLAASRQAARWLDREIAEERGRVERGEAELQRSRQQDGALEERKTMVAQRLSELNGAALRARSERMSKETAYQQVEDARQSGRSLRDLAALVPTAVVQQLSIDLATLQRRDIELSTNYGDRHPERIKVKEAIAFTESRLNAEVGRAIEALRRDVAAARQEEGKMAAALDAATAESSALGRKAVDYDALRRDVANDRALFERLQQRARELRLSSDYELSHVRIIDPAEVPRAPLPDTRWRNAAMGLGGSIVFAFLIAFGLHYLDERLHSPEDVKTYLGLPYLGMVPKLKPALLEASIAEPVNRPPPPFNEAMRDLRTHVLCTPAGRASRVLLVASADAGEGKTLVAANLAAGLAQVGYRVLLIDLDLRKPSLHDAFGVPLTPGLAELLSTGGSAADSIRAAGPGNLWILTAGRPRGNPGDLLGSAAFKRLLRNLPETFDRVVVDSPPVMAVTDASLVAHEQVGVLFVVSADRTARRAAQAALERLEAVGARFVGAVLNRVDLRRDGSAYYQRYDEVYGESHDEPPRAAAARGEGAEGATDTAGARSATERRTS